MVTSDAISTGTCLTTGYLLSRDKFPQTVPYVGGKWVKCTVPLTSTLILGSTLSCILSRLRGNKDDSLNYFYGFLPSGLIWTAVLRSSGRGAGMGLLFAVAAFFAKQHDINDANFATRAPAGRDILSGVYGGYNWGDLRWTAPMFEVRDPGRRPPV